MPLRNLKTASMWVLGAGSIFLGSMIAGKLETGLGVSDTGFTLASLVSLMLILIGGLLWISVAVALREKR